MIPYRPIRNARFLRIAATVVVTLGLLSALAGPALAAAPTAGSLPSVEITAYNGTKLDAIASLRDNSIKGTQYVDIKRYRLRIDGLATNPLDLTYSEVLANKSYAKVVTLHCVEGWDATLLWEGVPLKTLLDQAKVTKRANTVIFYATDGYSTSLPLAMILQKNMLLASKMNGVTLPPERGFPFQLVAESRLGYKWIKWIDHIVVSDDSRYRGYWETRGFSNVAALSD